MGSYIQVIIGGMLLVTAFLFGRHINNQPILPTSDNAEQVAHAKPLQRQIDSTPERESDPGPALQKSLRERILGQRKQDRDANSTASRQVNPNPDSPFVLPESETVVPDFSNFGTNQLTLPTKRVETKPVSKLPTPSSDGIAVGPIPKSVNNKIVERQPPQPSRKFEEIPKREVVTRRAKISIGRSPEHLVPVRNKEARLKSKSDGFLTYKTVFGDTLHSISSRFFGKPDYYLDIYVANRKLMDNPSSVPTNTTIRIPIVAELIERPDST